MSDIAYPLTPDRVTEMSRDFNILLSQRLTAKEARRAKNGTGNPRRSWVLLHNHVSLLEMQSLKEFFIARRGRWDSFNFTEPETSNTYEVRFDTDVLEIQKPLGRSENPRFTIEVRIREVL